MTKMTGGQALVEMLHRHGIDTLFGLPGYQNDSLYNALYDAQPTSSAIRVIHTRHEQGAAYMAYGYAKSTGRVGAYAVVPGPGMLNSTAALATAADVTLTTPPASYPRQEPGPATIAAAAQLLAGAMNPMIIRHYAK